MDYNDNVFGPELFEMQICGIQISSMATDALASRVCHQVESIICRNISYNI